MLTVKLFNDGEQIEELQIMLLGGGNQGVGGPTGYDYVLMRPKNSDMPPIAHKPEDGDLLLAAKFLYTYSGILKQNPDNIIQFPKTKK